MHDIMAAPSAYYWVATAPRVDFPPLGEPLSVDIAVIGAGIVGLTTALLLKHTGRRVAVIEAKRVGEQTTGGSTAKITAQHRLIYDHLIHSLGRDQAQLYAESNQEAITSIRELVQRLNIDCDLQERTAYAYTRRSDGVEAIEREAEAAGQLGLPARLLDGDIGLPYPVEAAVAFAHQAQFHPVKYLKALAAAVEGDDCRVLEQTRVLGVEEGQPCVIDTQRGKLRAAEVVVATHLPILDRAGFFARAVPRAHLGLAARLDGQPPQGMYISTDEPTHSLRGARDQEGSVLIAIGHGFRPGHDIDVGALYRELAQFVTGHFPVKTLDYRWMNMDYDSLDRVPYIGRLPPFSRHLYTATGFSAWGITAGHLAGRIITDTITGKINPYAELYDATRIRPLASARGFIAHNVHTARDFISDHLKSVPERDPDELAPGEGAIIQVDEEKVAAYRDDQGRLHM
ncbi:MAG: FAD-dependent oxidoreductase, partial [Candidatus Competibacteraceae bacterium]|nr:FAD-dependent oxidoreductase [Candidatus Competibacteraceae bacterium]